ncbi:MULTISPECIES: TetR family transcriptional regulator [unclassified Rhodococcus (in: high G+C Gram-positive bacteria)]|uniref:TetR/AcrR family transcriptional regulator n=1 Tax=Rhodococcus sp. SJ-3 TaxID=3454628 RepID=UPI002D86A6A8|nr:helix-turn-helix domain-containing protein [Rhodococcus sp. (in: high G+C Gram-positive bacteria)]
MTQLRVPLSRRDRQQQTREALIFAARGVFAEDGYHAASLDRIAREAGFSKGAVYSNFDGKSALFLAVMDQNLELAGADSRNPFEQPTNPASTGMELAEREGYPLQATQGFALATLEFIASAARDEALAPQLHQRLTAVLGHYDAIAQEARPEGEALAVSDVGKLLAALDQGAGLLLLAGDLMPDAAVFNAGMRRLVDPARAATEGDSEA